MLKNYLIAMMFVAPVLGQNLRGTQDSMRVDIKQEENNIAGDEQDEILFAQNSRNLSGKSGKGYYYEAKSGKFNKSGKSKSGKSSKGWHPTTPATPAWTTWWSTPAPFTPTTTTIAPWPSTTTPWNHRHHKNKCDHGYHRGWRHGGDCDDHESRHGGGHGGGHGRQEGQVDDSFNVSNNNSDGNEVTYHIYYGTNGKGGKGGHERK